MEARVLLGSVGTLGHQSINMLKEKQARLL